MSLHPYQKNIINPYAEQKYTQLYHAEGEVPPGVADTYEYDSDRNKFILDGIHQSFINYSEFPKLGTSIQIGDETTTITAQDLRAYSALYVQNAKVSGGELVFLGDDEIKASLRYLVEKLEENNSLLAYSTLTTPLAAEPENQEGLNKKVSNLVAIPPIMSTSYKNQIFTAFSLDPALANNAADDEELQLMELGDEAFTVLNTNPTVDLFDWTNNNGPEQPNNAVYYNSVDEKYYYTFRTAFDNVDDLDLGNIDDEGNLAQTIKERIQILANTGVQEILKFTGTTSDANMQNILNTNRDFESGGASPAFLQIGHEEDDLPIMRSYDVMTYKDPRPGSHWLIAVTISRNIVSSLSTTNALGFQEFELTSFQKSKVLVNPQKTPVLNEPPPLFTPLRLLRNTIATARLLTEYTEQLQEEGITPDFLNGLNLELEKDRIELFMDALANFYGYNSTPLEDEDRIQFFLNENYQLLYVCINGNLFTRATGNQYMASLSDPDERLRILNAFAYMSAGTFGYIKNSDEITNQYFLTTSDTREPWADFISRYTFPRVSIDPAEIERKLAAKKGSTPEFPSVGPIRSLRRMKRVYDSIEDLAQDREKSADAVLTAWNNRQRFLAVKTALQTNCQTGLAQFSNDAFNLTSLFVGGKVNTRTKIRQTIFILKRQLLANEDLRREFNKGREFLGGASWSDAERLAWRAERAARNPALARRELEKQINEQIFCGLDILGSELSDALLDPLADTVANAASGKLSQKGGNEPLKIELKKIPQLNKSSSQRKVWSTIINRMVENFIKSLVTAVARDLISALYGCGPENQNSSAPVLPRRQFDYGFTALGDLVEENTVPIERLALEAGMFRTVTREENGETITENIPYTEEELLRMLEGISQMTTPVEQEQLLQGDGTNDLYAHLVEVITSPSPVQWVSGYKIRTPDEDDPIGEAITRLKTRWIMGEPQQILTEYFTFETFPNAATIPQFKEKLLEFLLAIGDVLSQNEDEGSDLSPLEEYCRSLDNLDDNLNFRLSIQQLDEQYSMIVSSQINKINAYCDWLRSFSALELQINSFLDNLPIMKFYEDLLNLIAVMSNAFQDWFAGWIASWFEEDAPHTISQVRNLYSTKIGSELFYQAYRELHRTLPVAYIKSMDGIAYRTVPLGHPWVSNSAFIETDLKRGLVNNLSLPFEEPGTSLNAAATPDQRYGSYGKRTAPLHLKEQINEDYVRPNTTRQLNIAQYNERIGEEVISPYIDRQSYERPFLGYLTDLFMSLENSFQATEDGSRQGGIAIRSSFPTKIGASKGFEFSATDQDISPVIASYIPQTRNSSLEPGTDSYTNNLGVEVGLSYGTLFGRGDNQLGVYFDLRQSNAPYFNGMRIPSLTGYTNQRSRGRAVQDVVNSFSLGIFDNAADLENINLESISKAQRLDGNIGEDGLPPGRPSIAVGNWTVFNDEAIQRGFTDSTAQRRMGGWLRGTNRTTLAPSVDPCVTADDKYIALSIITVIQARIQEFFINTLSLASAYPVWGSLGTTQLVVDYLWRKITNQLSERNLLGRIYDNLGLIDKVYGNYPFDNPQLIFLSSQTPPEQLKVLIKSIYLKMLDNVSRLSEYNTINKGIFEEFNFNETLRENTTLARYRDLLRDFFVQMADDLELEDDNRHYGLSDAASNALAAYLRNSVVVFNEEQEVHELQDMGILLGQYYFPIAFLVGQYLIFYDYSVKPAHRFSNTNYQLQYEAAAADDQLLGALAGQVVDTFSVKYRGYPQGVLEYDGDNFNTFYHSDQVRARLEIVEEDWGNYTEVLTEDQRVVSLPTLVDPATFPLNIDFTQAYPDYFSNGGRYYNGNARQWVRGEKPQDFLANSANRAEDMLRGWTREIYEQFPTIESIDSDQQNTNRWPQVLATWREIVLNGYNTMEITQRTSLNYFQLIGEHFEAYEYYISRDGIAFSQAIEESLTLGFETEETARLRWHRARIEYARRWFGWLAFTYKNAPALVADLLEERRILRAMLSTD